MAVDINAYTKKDPIKAEGDRVTGVVDFEIDRASAYLPLHVVFCIDTSGSMSGTRIETAKEGLAKALDEVSSNDYFGVVGFSGSSSVVVPPTDGTFASDKKSDVRNLSAGGSTNIMRGLNRSKELLDQMPDTKAISWLVLISDGGSSINDSKLERDFSNQGITIYTAGIGKYEQRVIKTVAELTQGEWEDIGAPNNLQTFFREKVSEARGIVAVDPELELTPNELTQINDIHYTHGEQKSTLEPERRGEQYVVSLSDLNINKPPTVRLDLDVDGEPELDCSILDAAIQTRDHRATDSIDVEIAPPFIAEEENEGDEGLKDLAVAEAVDAALEEGPSAAETVLKRYQEDTNLDEDDLNEAKEVVDNMKSANDSEKAEEEVSRMLGRLNDGE